MREELAAGAPGRAWGRGGKGGLEELDERAGKCNEDEYDGTLNSG
jgi:hypothetical protein